MNVRLLNRYFLSLLSVLILNWSPINVQGQEVLNRIIDSGVLKVGVSGNQPPFSMEAIDGSIIGYEIDLADLIGDAMNVRVELVQLVFPELLPALEKGTVDMVMSGMTMTTKRNMRVAFVGPYLVTGKSLLTKNVDYTIRANSYNLNKKKIRIATMRGSTSHDYVTKHFPDAKLILVDDYDAAIEMLRKDEIEVMIADYAECSYASFKFSEDHFYVMEDPMTTERIGLALAPNDVLFINLMTNLFDKLSVNGEFQKLENEWFRSGSWLNRVN